MRLTFSLVTFLSLLFFSTVAQAWSPEDHEIFDLVASIQKTWGPDATFYSLLNLTKSASDKEITRAYRKRSLELHPDKNAGNPKIAAQFTQLGKVVSILRSIEKRKRYNHFYDHGVPVWRGTGYYYSRYRPGVFTVLVFLVLFSNALQLGLMHLQRVLRQKKLAEFRELALEAAYGPEKTPKDYRKFVKFTPPLSVIIELIKVTHGAPVIPPPGQPFDVAVENGQVFLQKAFGTPKTAEPFTEIEVTPALIPSVEYTDVWAVKLYKRLTGQAPPPAPPVAAAVVPEPSKRELKRAKKLKAN